MARPLRFVAVIGLLLAALSCLAVVPSNAKDEKAAPQTEKQIKPGLSKIAMKEFMRKKLSSSQEVIEGLAVEDFELIEKGARQLKRMSAAAEFRAINDPLYAEQANEFRRIVGKMEKAAQEKRLDGATLGFMDMTMSCVECHKHVRTILIAREN